MTLRIPVFVLAVVTVGFAILEMFLWNVPSIGGRVQDSLGEKAHQIPIWAANQGLYNFFLAAGLIWRRGLSGL